MLFSLGNMAYGVTDSIFNIILLGVCGTGKSACANTILLAGNPDLEAGQLFRSQASSVPITTECEFKTMEKPFGVPVRVVDTPDFFHEEIKNSQQQLERCKKYCQPGQCVVLLVMQLGRFTAVEQGMLEKLEHLLGWNIRDSTIVLLTHREDLKGSLDEFVQNCAVLRAIVSKCGWRFHSFSNSSKDPKQVMGLFKKIPQCNNIFPKFIKKKECYIC